MAGTLAGAREAPDRVVGSQHVLGQAGDRGVPHRAVCRVGASGVGRSPRSVTAEQPVSRPGRGEIRLAVLPRVYENDAWPVDLAGGSAGGFDTHPEAGGTVGYLTTGDQIRVRGGDRGGAGRLPRSRRDQRADATVRDPGVGAARRGGAAARWPRCRLVDRARGLWRSAGGARPSCSDPQGPRREEGTGGSGSGSSAPHWVSGCWPTRCSSLSARSHRPDQRSGAGEAGSASSACSWWALR